MFSLDKRLEEKIQRGALQENPKPYHGCAQMIRILQIQMFLLDFFDPV
jgi:hypothetical protein